MSHNTQIVSCFRCRNDDGSPYSSLAEMELDDNGIYHTQCPNGHDIVIITQAKKFEILFDLALHAFHDNYFMQAVSTASVAVERFLEFYIEVVSLKHNIDTKEFSESWAQVKNQSERQLGAFIFLFTIMNRRHPTLLGEKWNSFRNAVIHKGRLPNKKETRNYIEAVFYFIYENLKLLKTDMPTEVSKSIASELSKKASLIQSGMDHSLITVAGGTTINASEEISAMTLDFSRAEKLFMSRREWAVEIQNTQLNE